MFYLCQCHCCVITYTLQCGQRSYNLPEGRWCGTVVWNDPALAWSKDGQSRKLILSVLGTVSDFESKGDKLSPSAETRIWRWVSQAQTHTHQQTECLIYVVIRKHYTNNKYVEIIKWNTSMFCGNGEYLCWNNPALPWYVASQPCSMIRSMIHKLVYNLHIT